MWVILEQVPRTTHRFVGNIETNKFRLQTTHLIKHIVKFMQGDLRAGLRLQAAICRYRSSMATAVKSQATQERERSNFGTLRSAKFATGVREGELAGTSPGSGRANEARGQPKRRPANILVSRSSS